MTLPPTARPPVVPAASPQESRALQGPQPRLRELGEVFATMGEMMRGYRTLHFVGPCVTVFGSARFGEGHPYYEMARSAGAELARVGFTVMTGGGPGVMEAANRGAKEAGGHSVGCNIRLPMEQYANPYLDRVVTFDRFFVRKYMLRKYSYAFVVLPGGFGTLDEVFETLTLVQTGKIHAFPVVLMGRDYWRPLLGFLDEMVVASTISADDPARFRVTDDPAEAAAVVRDEAMARFGLTYGPRARPRWWLFERGLGQP